MKHFHCIANWDKINRQLLYQCNSSAGNQALVVLMRIIPLNHWCSFLLATNRLVTSWWQCFSFYPFNKYSFSTLIVKTCLLNRDSTKNAWRYQYGFFLWLHYIALYHIKCLVLPIEITCNFFLSLVLELAKNPAAYRKKITKFGGYNTWQSVSHSFSRR